MGRIWTICRLTIAEAVRKKAAILAILVLVLLLASLPFVMKGDNTLTGRVQTFLSYSMTSLGFLLSALTILLGCATVAMEIKTRQIYLIGTKPVPRWQIIFGKWLGIIVLNFILLGVGTGAVYGTTKWLASLPGQTPDDKLALANEVLTARASHSMIIPDFTQDVEARYQTLREQGRVYDVDDPVAIQEVKRNIAIELARDYRTVHSLQTRTWEFEGLLVKREPNEFVHLRYKMSVAPLPPREVMGAVWVIGDRTKGTAEFAIPRVDKVDLFHEVPIPAELVAEDGTLRVQLINVHPEGPERTYTAHITFEEEGKPEVLYQVGTFGGNLLRAASIILCRLMFLGAASVCASTFLGFPVACLTCMILYGAAAVSGFILESLDLVPRFQYIDEPLEYIGWVVKPLGLAIYRFIPRLSLFNPVPTLVEGRVVTLVWVLDSIGKLVLIRTTILGLMAYALFQRRELADSSIT